MEVSPIITLSEQLLLAVKLQKDTSLIRLQLETVSLVELKTALANDHLKKSFWINIYNSYFQILRKQLSVDKSFIYKQQLIPIAQHKFSLDEIEHGILRKNKHKYSLGYFTNYFTSKTIKQLTVEQLDYRIHFALNCGAESCPPIAFYNSTQIENQLELASQSFLESESSFDHDRKIIRTSALFKWYLADFGGKSGILTILGHFFHRNFDQYKIQYTDYSWQEKLDNFVN